LSRNTGFCAAKLDLLTPASKSIIIYTMQIVLDVPDDAGLSEFDLKVMLGVALYNSGIASSGRAADMLGIERRDFIENMGKFGGNILEIPLNQAKQDAENARRFAQ